MWYVAMSEGERWMVEKKVLEEEEGRGKGPVFFATDVPA